MAAPRGVAAFRPDQLWQQAREPLFWLDSALRLGWVNRAWEELTGHEASTVLGLSCAPVNPAVGETIEDLVSSLTPPPEAIRGQPSGLPTVVVSRAGARSWKRAEFWPFLDPQERLIGLLGILREPDLPQGVPDSSSRQLHVRLLELRERLRRTAGSDSFLGTGPAHARLLEQIRVAAATTAPVLIVGEPGTGKRLIARAIHSLHLMPQHPLVTLDCEALPAEVLDRELGKHLGGSAEGAPGDGQEVGRPDSATAQSISPSMTLLLGNILALPRDLQHHLVRSTARIRSVRIIATTSGDVEAAMLSERLRGDLYHALSVLVLRIPPLRERRGDLPILAQHFVERMNQRTGACCCGLEGQALSELEAYDWPGNVRELERVIAAAHQQARGRCGEAASTYTITAADLPSSIRGNLGAAYLPPCPGDSLKPLDELLTEIERRLIESALARARQNKSRAAELLGISRPRLYRRIKELNLPDDGEPEPQPTSTPAIH